MTTYAAAKAGISNFTAFMATECAKKFGEDACQKIRNFLFNPFADLIKIKSPNLLARVSVNKSRTAVTL